MGKWEYAAIIRFEFIIGNGKGSDSKLDERWILTTSTSSPIFSLHNHPKLKKLQERLVKNRQMEADGWQVINKKLQNQRNEELHRIIEKNELPNSVVIAGRGEDALGLIRTASEQGWETTGRTPDTGKTMMRRRVE